MVQYSKRHLDDTFAALSDATRRGVLLRLGRGNASITELAHQFHLSLTGINKHVGILERTGLVKTEKTGRVRTCRLGSCRLEAEQAWIEGYKAIWDRRFDALEIVVQELKQKEKNNEKPNQRRTKISARTRLVPPHQWAVPPRVRGLDQSRSL